MKTAFEVAEDAELFSKQKELGINVKQPKNNENVFTDGPQTDYMNWSIGSLFLCLVWGRFFFMLKRKD